MNAGDVFRLVGVADKHAKIVISDPVRYPDAVLFVGMTSYDAREDHSCILLRGEHSTCVVPRTCITYSRANAKASNAELDALVAIGRIEMFERVSDALLKRIRDGAMLSARTPLAFKRMLVEQGLVQNPSA